MSKHKENVNSGVGGALYFVGFLGAVIYFIQQANTITEGIIGIGKAFIWPAFLVYELFQFLEV